ncbi:phage baseplate protein [Segatella hominis]|uniref:phage baseplate protein n=1 Tax=Segatella hominis TaxID=2518605 RepID=UPI003AB5D760
MAGYVSKNLEQFRSIGYDALLYCKTNIAGYFFDGYLDVSINSELEITSHPVETGASIADHAYLKPQEITMTVLMSDVHESLVPGQFTGGWSRSVTAYNVLKKIQSDRITVSVLTRLGLFKNMILKSVIADDTDIELFGLRARVTLVELPVARVRTVEISEADQTTIQTEMGNIASTYPNNTELESILSMIVGWISGGG